MSCDCTNDVTTVAGEILNDLDNDSSLTVSYLSTWLRNNIGLLNNLVGSSITLDDSEEFTPCLDNDLKVILKNIYYCYYWGNQAKANLGANGWTKIEEGDSKITRVSRTDIAKTFIQLGKQCQESLSEMVKMYKQGQSIPVSISAYDSNMWLYPRINDQ